VTNTYFIKQVGHNSIVDDMVDEQDMLVIGLTGSFGSGCSTMRESLVSLGFQAVSLSSYVKKAWEDRNKKAADLAPRKELQDMGDELREKSGKTYYLAELALQEARTKGNFEKPLVFDSIRNLGELQFLRKIFRNFFLFAVDCSPKNRWERVKRHYIDLQLNENQFAIDDSRDKYDERTKYGQQVELCVDDADVLIDNEKPFPTRDIQIERLAAKINPYVSLVKGEITRSPSPFELYMAMAYTESSMSQCMQRHVGAVIVDERNEAVVSVGYNETPFGIEPCKTKYNRCSREVYKIKYFQKLESFGEKCPKCGEPIKDSKPPFLCKKCKFNLDKYFIADKALDRCAALHAEEKAILNVGTRDIQGFTIHTTTFPCYSCAKKIVHSKLGVVVYVEPYPDQDAVDVLSEGHVNVIKFEGVKARAYFGIFGRPHMP
jgi:deoxycytidylate deaminase